MTSRAGESQAVNAMLSMKASSVSASTASVLDCFIIALAKLVVARGLATLFSDRLTFDAAEASFVLFHAEISSVFAAEKPR